MASVEYGTTRRITNTPGQERSVSFSPDAKSILYAGERDGSWNLYKGERTDPDEPAFFNASALNETTVLTTAAEVPAAVLTRRERGCVSRGADDAEGAEPGDGENARRVAGEMNYSYTDGDQWYEWSADGRTIAVTFLSPSRWSNEVGIVNADGSGTVRNISRSATKTSGRTGRAKAKC